MAESATIRGESESFGLGRALAISAVLHLLLLLLSAWVPLDLSPAEEIARPEETSIEFSFRAPNEAETDEPASDFPPAPTPPRPAAIPDLAPAPEAEPVPDLPEIPQEPSPAPSEPFAEPVPPGDDAPIEPEPGEPGPEPFLEAPADDAADSRRDSERAGGESTSRPKLDLDEALRDFRRGVARRPTPPDPTEPVGSGPPRNVFVPDLSALPTTGFGMGNLRFESIDFDWSDYGRQIYMAIWRAWHNRLHVTTNEFDKWAHQERNWYLNHAVAVRFVIERSGQVTGIAVEVRSGCPPLDRSAVDALAEVLLPPLPAAFPRDREVVHARFLTRGDVRTMRQVLEHYKQLGLF